MVQDVQESVEEAYLIISTLVILVACFHKNLMHSIQIMARDGFSQQWHLGWWWLHWRVKESQPAAQSTPRQGYRQTKRGHTEWYKKQCTNKYISFFLLDPCEQWSLSGTMGKGTSLNYSKSVKILGRVLFKAANGERYLAFTSTCPNL